MIWGAADPRGLLAALAGRIEKVRGEVAVLRRLVESFWTRSCYRCGKELRKENPGDVVRCECGWVWE